MTLPMRLRLDMRTRNPLNGAIGNSKIAGVIRARERAGIRGVVRLRVMAALKARPELRLPCLVTVTRISAGTLDAWDGLPAALKPVVDGIADAFGVRDDDARLRWERPRQRKGPRGEHAVEIEIAPRASAERSTGA